MRTILTAISLMMMLATQAVAGETVMVCNTKDYGEKNYYKLVNPLFGASSVKQKIDSRWLDWCKEDCTILDIYESGAKQEQKFWFFWDKSFPKEGIRKTKNYYIESTYLLDFEFGKRTVDIKVYTDKSKTKELKKIDIRQDNRDYSCEIQ